MATFENPYGLYFPLLLSEGAPIVPSLEDSVDSSLRIILAWDYTKRHFLYTFGSILSRLVSAPGTNQQLVAIKQFIAQAIRRWEPRIEVQEIEVLRSGTGDSIEINIKALILETQTIYNYTTQI